MRAPKHAPTAMQRTLENVLDQRRLQRNVAVDAELLLIRTLQQNGRHFSFSLYAA